MLWLKRLLHTLRQLFTKRRPALPQYAAWKHTPGEEPVHIIQDEAREAQLVEQYALTGQELVGTPVAKMRTETRHKERLERPGDLSEPYVKSKPLTKEELAAFYDRNAPGPSDADIQALWKTIPPEDTALLKERLTARPRPLTERDLHALLTQVAKGKRTAQEVADILIERGLDRSV